jgi:hypothetical protein
MTMVRMFLVLSTGGRSEGLVGLLCCDIITRLADLRIFTPCFGGDFKMIFLLDGTCPQVYANMLKSRWRGVGYQISD